MPAPLPVKGFHLNMVGGTLEGTQVGEITGTDRKERPGKGQITHSLELVSSHET